jgi:hypothetical protein
MKNTSTIILSLILMTTSAFAEGDHSEEITKPFAAQLGARKLVCTGPNTAVVIKNKADPFAPSYQGLQMITNTNFNTDRELNWLGQPFADSGLSGLWVTFINPYYYFFDIFDDGEHDREGYVLEISFNKIGSLLAGRNQSITANSLFFNDYNPPLPLTSPTILTCVLEQPQPNFTWSKK